MLRKPKNVDHVTLKLPQTALQILIPFMNPNQWGAHPPPDGSTHSFGKRGFVKGAVFSFLKTEPDAQNEVRRGGILLTRRKPPRTRGAGLLLLRSLGSSSTAAGSRFGYPSIP